MLGSDLREIAPDYIFLENNGQRAKAPNDDVIICAGGVLPTAFLKSIGVEVETKFGTA